MKRDRTPSQFLWLIPIAGLLLPSSLAAQPQITVTPTSLTIAATKGTTETRTITLRSASTGSNSGNSTKANPQLTPFDLANTDGSQVLPASWISMASPQTTNGTSKVVNLPVNFNLQNAPSGEFTGEMLLTYQGNEQVIPVIIRVKDPWQLPLLLLFAGVGLSVIVSAYSVSGKRRDEITSSIQNLSDLIQPDKNLARSFWERANECLNHVALLCSTQMLDAAQAELNIAQTLWRKWLQYRMGWLSQFDYYDTVKQRLSESDLENSRSVCIRAIARNLNDTLQKAPDLSTPDELRQKLDEIAQQVNRFIQVSSRLDKLKSLVAQLDGQEAMEWEDQCNELEEQLLMLAMADETSIREFKETVEKKIQTVKSKLEEGNLAYDIPKAIGSDTGIGLTLVPPPETTSPHSNIAVPQSFQASLPPFLTYFFPDANGRLRWFYIFSYLTIMGVLAGTGFNQLYLTKPTFGSWADYIAVLAWGFGAESTRSAAVKALRKTDETAPQPTTPQS